VTGSSQGIGFECARHLRRMGGRVVLAVRNTEAGENAKKEILARPGTGTVEVRKLDLASFASVREFAESWKAQSDKDREIHILVHNAGVMPASVIKTIDGFELVCLARVCGLPVLALTSLFVRLFKQTISRHSY
jgi:NAD(P)-dependent dehydrogenase (short-subunit alcohol dehydrogenase family)